MTSGMLMGIVYFNRRFHLPVAVPLFIPEDFQGDFLNAETMRVLVFVMLCLCTATVYGRRLHQTATSSLPQDLPRLSVDAPMEGQLTRNTLKFGLTVKAKNGTFPDILLSLEVINKGANADIYCSPYGSNLTDVSAVWSSDSAQGTDYLFISTNSAYYNRAITDTDAGIADFVCTMKHVSHLSPVYYLEMEVSYIKRQLNTVEMAAMEQIYDLCCLGTDACLGWKERWHSVELEAKNGTREVTNFDFCHMTDNVCDRDGRLLKISMNRFGLQCAFPIEQIVKFQRLQKLSMIGNQLSGNIFDIAESLRKLKHLDELKLSHNRITGVLAKEIDDPLTNPICALSRRHLKHLHLQANVIDGSLPECLLSEGSSLRDLILDQNPISGVLPDVIAEGSNLEVIRISDANLSGPFPSSFIHAEHLILLDLSENQMDGELPNAFGPTPKLKQLYLSGNNFTGAIPDGIAASITLESVYLDHNAFTSIPHQWLKQGPSTPLSHLDISFNQIKQEFPVALSLSPHLSTLKMNSNKFYGPLPSVVNLLPNAWVINASENNLTGALPDEWTSIGLFRGTANELKYSPPLLDLSYNQLSGRVPAFFFNIDNYPKALLVSKSVKLQGNEFLCPEYGTATHIHGFEKCGDEDEDEDDPVFGDNEFDVTRDTDNSAAFGADEADETVTTSSSSESPSSSSSHKDWTFVIVISIVAAAVSLSVGLALLLRMKMAHLAKSATSNPDHDVEIGSVKPEALNSSRDLEQSKLRSGVQSSAPV